MEATDLAAQTAMLEEARRQNRMREQATDERVVALKARAEMLESVLDEIAHPGHVYGEGDYYCGMEAGLASTAEIASEALESYREGAPK